MINVSDFAAAGIPDHRSGSGSSAPSHVYARGIVRPAVNAGLVSAIVSGTREVV
jgi:hypothetical protein